MCANVQNNKCMFFYSCGLRKTKCWLCCLKKVCKQIIRSPLWIRLTQHQSVKGSSEHCGFESFHLHFSLSAWSRQTLTSQWNKATVRPFEIDKSTNVCIQTNTIDLYCLEKRQHWGTTSTQPSFILKKMRDLKTKQPLSMANFFLSAPFFSWCDIFRFIAWRCPLLTAFGIQ